MRGQEPIPSKEPPKNHHAKHLSLSYTCPGIYCSTFYHQPATLMCARQSYMQLGDVPAFNTLCELLGEATTEAAVHLFLSPNGSFCHLLLPIHSGEQTSFLTAERLTPTIFSKKQVRGLLLLHDPGDNLHTKPDQQHSQRGIKDKINKVAKSRVKKKKKLKKKSGFSCVLKPYQKYFISIRVYIKKPQD